MTEELTPRELANAKKQARATRIANIRRQVAITAATLAAVFSGVIMARTQLNQPVNPAGTQVAMVSKAPGDGESEGSQSEGDESGIAETVVKVASGAADAVFGSSSSGSQSPSTTSTAPAPTPAPLVTSQS